MLSGSRETGAGEWRTGCRLAGCIALVLCLAGASDAFATVRYASPTGSGTTCSQPSPCTVKQAIEGAGSGDDVYVPGDQGDYSEGATITTPGGVHVHGTNGRPRLIFSAGQFGVNGPGTAENLYIEGPGSTFALHAPAGASANNVIVKVTDTGHACYFSGGHTVTNSVCWAGSTGDLAVETDGANTFRNDTFVGGTEAAVKAFGRSNVAGNDTLVNVIARSAGSGHDLEADASDNTADATISATYSNYATTISTDTTARDHINGDATDQTAAPLFANAAGGDFHQALGSPTIDHGTNDLANGSADFDGGSRTVNGVTDIGADEFNSGGGAPGTRASTTTVVCNYHFATFSDTCFANVADAGAPPAIAPTGGVSFASSGGGIFTAGARCSLVQSVSGGSPSCSVEFLPPAIGTPTMTATYAGDSAHAGSSGFAPLRVTSLGDGQLVSHLGILPPSLLAAPSGGSVAKKPAAVGATVTFTLRAPARVTFTVQKPAAGRLVRTGTGRRVRTSCKAPNRSNLHKRKCTRWLTLRGNFTRVGTKGKNTFRFRGRIGNKTLKPGSYRLVATPSVGGVKGKPTSRNFRVKRP